MRVLVCVKRVPAPGARIVLTDDGRAIDTRNLGFTTSPHEECAVEEAIRLVEAHGGEVTVVTLGLAEAEEQLRYAISVGAHHAVLLCVDDDLDAQHTAGAITEAIRDLEARDGAFDLILCGNESADSGGFQVGIRIARSLGRPVVSGIKNLEIRDHTAVVRRECSDGYEVYTLALPAVVAVKEGINLPRYATLPGRLRSKKAPLAMTHVERGPQRIVTTRFETPPEVQVSTVVLGSGGAAAPAVVDVLIELGLA